jgi:hypothetical protein
MGDAVTATGKLRIKRDGKLLAEVDDRVQAIAWLHKHQPQSYDWALKHEGYMVENADGTPALEPYSK